MENWQKNLYSIWAAQFLAAVGLSMVLPFLPFYIRELGVNGDKAVKIWSGLIFAAPFMVSVFMQPLWGILGDRNGRKPMIVRGMAGIALATFLMGFARTAPQLLFLRFLQGAISGFVAPSLALVATSTPREKTGQALGTLQSALVTGMVLGPLLGGVFAHFMGFRSIFFWTGGLCFVGAFVAYRFVREDFVRPDKAERSSLRYNISYILHSPQLRAMLGLLILVQFSIQVVAPFLSLYVESLHVSPEYVGLVTGMVFGITGVTNAVTSPLWGRQADRHGFRKVLQISLLGMIIFYLPQAFVTEAWQLLFLRAGLGIFVAGAIPTINAIVHRSTLEKDRGGMYGIFQSGLMIGNVAGPLLGGSLAAIFGLPAIFLITTGLMVLAFFWEKKAAVNPCGSEKSNLSR